MRSESPLRLLLLLATLFGIAETAFTRPAGPGLDLCSALSQPSKQARSPGCRFLSLRTTRGSIHEWPSTSRSRQADLFHARRNNFSADSRRKAAGRPLQSWAVKTVPYSLDGKSETEVQVRFQVEIPKWWSSRWPPAPRIFAFLSNPERAVVLNQDGSVNSQSNPPCVVRRSSF